MKKRSVPKIVLGIDPGTARCGYGLVSWRDGELTAKAFGVIETPAGADRAYRLAELQHAIARLLKRHAPDVVAVEELYFSKNVKTAMAVAEARGVVLAAAAAARVSVAALSPGTIKQTITSSGRAPKQQVGRMVALLLKLPKPPRPDDAADALACAITCLRLSR
ncbi:crossover junction endodeoxyribonuclease RuvC [Candidatus Parcubacteria bacterium]|nr:crossover junction endodeoxyribonuclease RuvC [Candidatus Parcubacteria bacterium]